MDVHHLKARLCVMLFYCFYYVLHTMTSRGSQRKAKDEKITMTGHGYKLSEQESFKRCDYTFNV